MINFKFQPKVCNDCHDMTEKIVNFDDVTTAAVKEDDFRIRFWFITKTKAVNTELKKLKKWKTMKLKKIKTGY